MTIQLHNFTSPPDVPPHAEPTKPSAEELLYGASRLWLGVTAPGLQVRLFRRCVTCDGPVRDVEIQIAAESYYHLWVNGHYVTRGPTFHHTADRPVARLDLTPWWQPGENTIAVLVFTPGFPTHQVPTGEPGLWAAIRVRDEMGTERWIVSDSMWAATDQVGWRSHAVRHGWALGPVEMLDAASHPWGWQLPDFDDSDWPCAQIVDANATGRTVPVEVEVPPLTFSWAGIRKMVSSWRVSPKPAPLESGQSCEVLGQWLQDEPWTPIPANSPTSANWNAAAGELKADGLTDTHGIAIVLDFGCEQVGNITFECESDSQGIIEIGWSEVMRSGRPEMIHKGTTYADRLIVRPGWQQWESLQFTGLRYLVLILRGFKGSVRFRDVGIRTSTSVPQLNARFASSMPRLDAIWSLCTRTLSVGTQETIIDCPSREQAPYLGDGHLVGRWLGTFTGDYRHWRYLIELGFNSQADDGLLRDAPLFPVHRSLIDYVLFTVMAVRDYVDLTGDLHFGQTLLHRCRRAMGYFDRQLDSRSLLRSLQVPGVRDVPWDIAGPPRQTASLDPHLFIDHPGLGGHNVGDPGIERRGRSAALNAMYVLALDAMGDLEQWVGQPHEAMFRRDTAARVRIAIANAYWDSRRGLFVDAIDESGKPFEQLSEQTNVLAMMAEIPCPVAPADLIGHVLSPHPHVARCGPYFYAYLLPLMGRHGMHAEGLAIVHRNWGRMLDAGATTLWETFAGDSFDTWCHPWSAVPAFFLVHEILGLQLDNMRKGSIALRPRYDLIPHVSGQLPTTFGPISLSWQIRNQSVHLSGQLPTSLRASLYPSSGESPIDVASSWTLQLPLPPALRTCQNAFA